jgi:photosystem II stability/assembly factor-like uncharacterized protein
MNRQHRAAVSWIASRWMGGLLLALALAVPARAQVNRWTPFGPGGGSISSLAVDPGNPARVYAVAAGTLYRSTDGGATWTLQAGANLQVVALDPAHPSTLYAGGQNLLRSTDGGAIWTDASPRLVPGTIYHTISALAVAPGGVVFAGDADRLLRSADGGRSWSQVSSQSTGGILSIQVDPSHPGTVYYASVSTVFKSTDGGTSWSDLGQPPIDGLEISRLALAPSAPGTLYLLATPAGSPLSPTVFRSDDGGASWREAGQIANDRFLYSALLVDPRNALRVYAAGLGGLFASADGGVTWAASSQGLPPDLLNQTPRGVLALAAAPSRPDILYAGTVEWGVGKSLNAGARWRIGVEPGLNGGLTQMLKFDPRLPGTIYVGIGTEGTRSFRSQDDGHTWTPFARGLSSTSGLEDLAFDLTDPNVLYAANLLATWKSGDGGETWVRIGDPSLRVAVTGPQTLLAGACGLNRTTNGGGSWKEVIPCLDPVSGLLRLVRSIQVDPVHPANVYVELSPSTGAETIAPTAFRSQDGGATWQSLTPGFVVAPSLFRVLYRLDVIQKILLRSSNGGRSWTVVNAHLPWSVFGGLAVDGSDPNKIYIVSARGLLISRDGGRTLGLAPDSYLGRADLITDRNHPGFVYANRVSIGGLLVGHFE